MRNIRLSIFWLISFLALTLIFYWPTRSAGFVTDWLGWEQRYRAGGWADVLRSFGYQGLHPVLHFFNFSLYSLFGKSDTAWYISFSVIHAINAWLIGSLYLRLAPERMLWRGAIGAALLFLLSPYAAEPMVWRVCLHYLLALMFSLLAIHSTLDYLEQRTSNHLFWVHLCFLLALFCLEWTLVLPGIVAVLIVWWQIKHRTFEWRPWLWLCGVQAALIACWFGLNTLAIGQAVGHYGAEKHFKFVPYEMLATTWKYLLKNLLFLRYWPHPLKERGFALLEQPFISIGLLLLFAVLLGYGIKKALNHQATVLTILLMLVCFAIATLPVSNLYFYFIDHSENDRYGYFGLAFFWIAAIMAITQLPGFLGRVLVIGLFIISLITLTKTTRLWHDSDIQYRSLIQDFHHYDKENVLLLAIPDNFQGVYMYRMIGGESAFKEALELHTNKPFKGNMAEAVMYNAQSLTDAIKATTDSTRTHYQLSFEHPGSWWWWNGIGASDRETDWFQYRRKEPLSEVQLKEQRPSTVVLYPVQGKWVEVK